MATFVHIADAKNRDRIARNGIRLGRRGVFSLPVTKNFFATHQWSRELRRYWQAKALVCIQFRVPDDEIVSVGTFRGPKILITAAEAVATAADHKAPLGLEVIFSRRIRADEILRIYPAPRVAGWRFSPSAKGIKPCGCRYCQKGEIRGRRLRWEGE